MTQAYAIDPVLAALPDLVSIIAPDGTMHYLNPAGCQMLLVSSSTDVTGGLYTLLTPADAQFFLETAVPQAISTGVWQGEMDILIDEGLSIPLAMTLIKNEPAHTPPSLTLIARDITQRRWTETSLRESEARFRSSFENSALGMTLVSIDGRFLQVNLPLCHILGYTEAEFFTLSFLHLIHPNDRQHHHDTILQLLQGTINATADEVQIHHKDGRYLWIRLNATSIRDQEGQIIYFLIQMHDITASKEAEQTLRQSQTALKAQADSLSAINVVADTLYHSLDFSMVVERATDAIAAYTHAPAVAFFTLDTDLALLRLIASRGLSEQALQHGRILPLHGSLSGLTVARKEITLSDDLAHDSRLQPDVQKELTRQSLTHIVSLPLLFQEQVLGVINLIFPTPPHFTRQEFDTLLAIGKTIGLAMSNARYLDQLASEIQERRQLEDAIQSSLELRNRQIEISQELAAARTEDDILQILVNRGAYYPQIGLVLFLRDATTPPGFHVIKAQNPFQSGLMPMPSNMQIPFGEMSPIFNANESFVCQDTTSDPRLDKTARRITQRIGIASWGSFPLSAGGEWLGNLTIAGSHPHQFPEQISSFYQSLAEQGATALRAARLLQETQASLERRRRQVALTTQVAQEIAAATDLEDLYQRVVNQVKEQFGYYHVQLLRYDPAMDTVALVFGYGKMGERMLEMHHSMPMGVGFIGTVATTGHSLLRPDITGDKDWHANPLLPQTKGELAVPIRLRHEVLGVLDVQSDIAGQLNADDQLLLEGLCGQIAIAIESTRLRQEMEANLRELSALQRHMSREGWQQYKRTRENFVGYQFDHAGVHAVATNQPENGRSRSTRSTTAPLPSNRHQTTLQIRGESIGLLTIEEDPNRPLTPEDHSFLLSISDQVAEALEVARLFEQTQDSLLEQERMSSELETVAQVSTAASTILDEDTLLQTVVDLAKASFNLYHAHIYLLDDYGDTLTLKAGAGNIGRLMTLEGREILIEATSIVARAARTHTSIIENDVQKSFDFIPHPLLPHIRSEMAIPLIVGNKLIGVLDLLSDRLGYFSAEDIKIYQTLTSQVAVAVENAKLYATQVETADKLRQVDRLKSEFLASMSHELRTPLNSIIGFADVLLEGLDGDLNERMEEDISLIRQSGAHLRELIGDILDLSKIEAGRMELRYETINMREMAHDIIATAQPLVQEKSLTLHMEIGHDVNIIEADRTRMRQVLWNIMGNAIKFTEKGGITLIMNSSEKDLLIGIRDTGIGIKQEDIGIVFEQFRQIDGSLNRRAGGTGLGMPISKKLVELHGGQIWVESTYGIGTTFWFTIPLSRQHARAVTGMLNMNMI